MNIFRQQSPLWAIVLCSGAMVASCGAEPSVQGDVANYGARQEAMVAPEAPEASADLVADVPKAAPQLIKTAQLDLTVESIDEMLPQVTAIAQQQRGDIISLQNSKPQNSRDRHTATLKMRVPQAQLDATLEKLAALGTVRNQSLSAEDVSQQLVDFQARLRNLRKTEEMLLKIMDRSGSMGDVLQVTQRISEVRSQIEQIDAQLKDLQNRVAYSTINLNIEAIFTPPPVTRPVETQFGDTWSEATNSMKRFSVGLAKVFLWLLAYSPYLAIIGLPWGFMWYRRRRMAEPPSASRPSDF
jgi:ACT domain-containing protein